MSRQQDNETLRRSRNPEKDKGSCILGQCGQRHNETCTRMLVMSKEKTKSKIGHRTRNRQTRGGLKGDINRSHHQTTQIQGKGFDIGNQRPM